MRLSLPERFNLSLDAIADNTSTSESVASLTINIPLVNIIAYDISILANKVYCHNFEHGAATNKTIPGKVITKAIDSLKVNDVDNVAHIWTMSPPCQPYTTTKGKHIQI